MREQLLKIEKRHQIDSIRHDEYYVKIAVAWAISICYIKFEELTLDYLNIM